MKFAAVTGNMTGAPLRSMTPCPEVTCGGFCARAPMCTEIHEFAQGNPCLDLGHEASGTLR
jgi:hypothetical protein